MFGKYLRYLVVAYYKQRVEERAHSCYAVESLTHLFRRLEVERYSYYSHGKYTELVAHFGNDRSRSRTCTAPHSCGDECHFGIYLETPVFARNAFGIVYEHISYFRQRCLGSFASFFGVVAGTESGVAE